MNQTEGYLTREELAKEWRVTERTIDLWRKKAGLPSFKLGRLVRFEREDVEGWKRKNKVYTKG